MSRLFTFSDLWTPVGGWPCEHEGCSKKSYAVSLFDKDEQFLEQAGVERPFDGPEVALMIIKFNLGKVCCDEHRVC